MGVFANCVSRQHLNERGEPLDGGLIYCYTNGTTDLHNMYSDYSLTTQLDNPLTLDSRGDCQVFWDGNPVRFELWYDSKLVESWISMADTSGGDIATERAQRIAADAVLQANIDAEASTRSSADTILQTNINNETTARTNADTALQSQITTNLNALNAHIADTDNPHEVTASQVGAYSTTEADSIF